MASVVLMREPWEEGRERKGRERKGRGGDRQGRREREREGGEVKGKGCNEKELDIISLTFLFMSPSILATVNRVTIPAISLLAP